MRKRKQTPESGVLQSICEYLEVGGYVFWRMNNVGVYDPRSKIFRAMPKYSMKGVSDIIALCNGKAYFIECKSKTGTQRKEQKEFENYVKIGGAEYILAKSVDDIREFGF